MQDQKETNIPITIDGLMLFAYSNSKQSFNIRLNTVAKKHRFIVEVTQDEKVFGRYFDREALIAMQPFCIFVADAKSGEPLANSAATGEGYDKMLNLESDLFYPNHKGLNQSHYEASLHLNHGVVEGGNAALDCYRVTEDCFSELESHITTAQVWKTFVEETNRQAAGSIRQFSTELELDFVRDVVAKLQLLPGQMLRITQGADMSDLFPPIQHGSVSKVKVNYDDEEPPTSLAECIGFAHHCRAFDRQAGEPIYGLFKVNFVAPTTNDGEDAESALDDEANFEGRTTSGCCFLGCTGPED